MAYKSQTGFDSNNQKVINVASPTSNTDAANKVYVDALVQGLSWKADVRVATTTNGTLATAYANGQTVDGLTLATGDRILVKNQTTQTENGIYTVNVSGAPTRAVDADASTELNNATVSVLDGSVNGQSTWVQSTKNPTIGSSNIVWVSGPQNVSAGNGLTGTTTFSVLLDTGANSGLAVSASGVKVNPGTGITTSGGSTAVDFSVVPKKFAQDIGNGALTVIPVTHNLGTKDFTWSLRDNATDTDQLVDLVHTSTTVATLTFPSAPTTAQFRFVAIG